MGKTNAVRAVFIIMQQKRMQNTQYVKYLLWSFLQKYDTLRDLVAFVQFKKREKHPWRSVNLAFLLGFSLQLY